MGETPHIPIKVSMFILRPMRIKQITGDQIKLGLSVAMLVVTTVGCVGYVDGGYGGAIVVPAPDVYFYGGYERGREVHSYSHRGFESRAVAHPVGRRSIKQLTNRHKF